MGPQWYNGDKLAAEDTGSVYQYNTLIGGVLIMQAIDAALMESRCRPGPSESRRTNGPGPWPEPLAAGA